MTWRLARIFALWLNWSVASTTLWAQATTDASMPSTTAEAPGRFMPQGSTVTDRLTGLVWQRCSVGQRWTVDLGCVGLATKLWFHEALKLQDKAWRLPAVQEIRGLYNANLSAMLDTDAFPDAPPTWFWAVQGPQRQAAALGVSCGSGGNDSCYQSDARAVRLVRRQALRPTVK